MGDYSVFLTSKLKTITMFSECLGLLRKILFILLFNLCIFFPYNVLAENKLPNKVYLPSKPVFPFKAKTTNECIHERECAWYYFVKFQERVSDDAKKEYGNKLSEDDANPVIKKWKTPVNFLVLPQKNNQEYIEALERVLIRVRPHFLYDLKIKNKQFTAVLMFSDDFRRDLFGTYKSFFSNTFGDALFKAYNSFEITQPIITSMSFPANKDNTILATAVFMNPDKSVIDSAIESKIFYNLGFTGLSFSTPYFPSENHSRMNDLHFFLIRILYDPEMREGTRLSDSQAIFNRIYPHVLNNFNAYNAEKDTTK